MSAKPQRNPAPLTEPVSDDADQLRALVSAMLSGSYQEESYLWDVSSLCQAKPEFARRLLALVERYHRLGQMPAAQYTRIREKIAETMPPDERRARASASTVTMSVTVSSTPSVPATGSTASPGTTASTPETGTTSSSTGTATTGSPPGTAPTR